MRTHQLGADCCTLDSRGIRTVVHDTQLNMHVPLKRFAKRSSKPVSHLQTQRLITNRDPRSKTLALPRPNLNSQSMPKMQLCTQCTPERYTVVRLANLGSQGQPYSARACENDSSRLLFSSHRCNRAQEMLCRIVIRFDLASSV